MKLHGVIALSLIFISSACFGGGFGKGTLLKAAKYDETLFRFFEKNAHIFKKRSMLNTIYKGQAPLYPLECGYTDFPTFHQQEMMRLLEVKEVAAKKLIGIVLKEIAKNSVFFDIVSHPSQQFYKENPSKTDCFLSQAAGLKVGDSLICFEGATMTRQTVHQVYQIHNEGGTVLVPQAKKPLLLLASEFGAVSYVPAVEITEEN